MLLHGAWHDRACWKPLVSCLTDLSLEVHAPDLPGHGENAADPAAITLKTYSRYISQYIDNIDKNVFLIGHSMSGMVISQVAEMQPERVQRLVYLAAYLPQDGQSLFDVIADCREQVAPAAVERAMQMSTDKRLCSIADADIAPLFYNRCPADSLDQIPRRFPAQAVLPLSGKVSLTAERFGRVPKTYICCLDDQVIPIRHQRHMLTRQRCDEMIQLDCDHSPFLSCPEELASVLHSISAV